MPYIHKGEKLLDVREMTQTQMLCQVDYLRGLITMESMVIICLVVSYIILLSDFHKKQLPPDVLREDITNSAMLTSSNGEEILILSWDIPIAYALGEVIGCPEPSQMVDVLERQAEMIRSAYAPYHPHNLRIVWFYHVRYLHEHSENLGRKILLLTRQLSQKERVA